MIHGDTSTPRGYLDHYVLAHGGVRPTAKRLGIEYAVLLRIVNGRAGITRTLALRMARVDPLLDAGKLALVGPVDRDEVDQK